MTKQYSIIVHAPLEKQERGGRAGRRREIYLLIELYFSMVKILASTKVD